MTRLDKRQRGSAGPGVSAVTQGRFWAAPFGGARSAYAGGRRAGRARDAHCDRPTQRLAYFDFFSYHPTNCRPVPIAFHPTAYVDVSETIDAKMHSITAHASQFGGRGLDTEMYRELAHVQGRMIGVPYAEGLDVQRMLLA